VTDRLNSRYRADTDVNQSIIYSLIYSTQLFDSTIYHCLHWRFCSDFAGGLDEALNNIIDMSRQQNVPFVFALGRRALGRVCAKLVPVSIVGIFCYEGTEVSINIE